MGNSRNVSETKRAVLNRLRSAEGHLHGVIRMYEADNCCEEVLEQLNAVEAALCAAGRLLRDNEFQRCAEIILHSLDADIRVGELKRLIALYKLPKHLLAIPDIDDADEQTKDCSGNCVQPISEARIER